MADEQPKKINITRWFPDTCNCALEYAWEADSNEDERIHTPHKVIDTCPHHDHLRADLHGHHAAIHEENSHKNIAIAHVLEHLPDEHKAVIAQDDKGNITHWFKYDPHWSFNEKRELEIAPPSYGRLHGVSCLLFVLLFFPAYS